MLARLDEVLEPLWRISKCSFGEMSKFTKSLKRHHQNRHRHCIANNAPSELPSYLIQCHNISVRNSRLRVIHPNRALVLVRILASLDNARCCKAQAKASHHHIEAPRRSFSAAQSTMAMSCSDATGCFIDAACSISRQREAPSPSFGHSHSSCIKISCDSYYRLSRRTHQQR